MGSDHRGLKARGTILIDVLPSLTGKRHVLYWDGSFKGRARTGWSWAASPQVKVNKTPISPVTLSRLSPLCQPRLSQAHGQIAWAAPFPHSLIFHLVCTGKFI
jgi:hypothetical protein